MYTEIYFSANLRKDISALALLAIKFMADPMANDYHAPSELPDHSLFKTDRWKQLMTGHSYYLTGSSLQEFRWDEIGSFWALTFKADIKNYSDEIAKWLDFVEPLLYGTPCVEHLGHFRYEEDTTPTLLYQLGYKIVQVKTPSPETEES